MKVLLINGSPRKNGNTHLALTEVAKTLEAEGLETEIFWIGNKPVRGCTACYACISKNLGKCVFNDDICNQLSARFADADAFVIGSPTCRRGGSTAAFQCMNMPFEMLNSILIGSQYWNVAFGRDPGEVTQDAEGMQTMRTLGKNMAWVLKNLHRDSAVPRSSDEEWQPMHFIR